MSWVILTIVTRWRFKMLFGFQHLPSSQILGSVKNFTGPIKSSSVLLLRRLSPPLALSLPPSLFNLQFYGRGLRAMDQPVIRLMTGHYLKSVSLIPNAATASLNFNKAFPRELRDFESCGATLTRVSVTSFKCCKKTTAALPPLSGQPAMTSYWVQPDRWRPRLKRHIL